MVLLLDALRGHAHRMCRALATAKACRKSKVTLYQQRKEASVFLILASVSSVDYRVLIWTIRNLNCSRQLYSEHLLLALVVNSFSVSSNWIFLLTAVLSKLWTGVLLAVKLYTCGGRGHIEHLKIVTPTKCLAFAVLINCVGVARSYPTFFSWIL